MSKPKEYEVSFDGFTITKFIEKDAYDKLLKKVEELEPLANKWKEYEKTLKRLYDTSKWKGGPIHVPEGSSK